MSAKHARKIALRGGTVLATGAAVLLAAGTAYAYWSVAGAGSGSGVTGTASALAGGTASSTGLLYPGSSVSGSVVMTNGNSFDVLVSGVSFGAAAPDAGHSTCTTTGVTFTWSQTTLTVPKNSTAVLNYTAAMSNASMNECQGATFTAPFTVTDGKSVTP